MNLQIADLEMNNLLDRDAMGALMGGSITVLSPWQTISSQSSYGNYANGSYFNLKKSVFGFTVIYGKKRYDASDRDKDGKVTVWEFSGRRYF